MCPHHPRRSHGRRGEHRPPHGRARRRASPRRSTSREPGAARPTWPAQCGCRARPARAFGGAVLGPALADAIKGAAREQVFAAPSREARREGEAREGQGRGRQARARPDGGHGAERQRPQRRGGRRRRARARARLPPGRGRQRSEVRLRPLDRHVPERLPGRGRAPRAATCASRSSPRSTACARRS